MMSVIKNFVPSRLFELMSLQASQEKSLLSLTVLEYSGEFVKDININQFAFFLLQCLVPLHI